MSAVFSKLCSATVETLLNRDSQTDLAPTERIEPFPIHPGVSAVEGYKVSVNGDGLRIVDHLPEIIQRGAAALTPAEKELLKWVGVFFRRPTPGKFMMRIRMPNGFVRSDQLRTVAELSRRLGNSVVDITPANNSSCAVLHSTPCRKFGKNSGGLTFILSKQASITSATSMAVPWPV